MTEFDISLVTRRATSEERRARLTNASFGSGFTEHMVSLQWSVSRGWHSGKVTAYQPLSMDPATVGLHYGQVVFEGLKAYRTADGRSAVFRPEAHAERFQRSARRLMMPELPVATFVRAAEHLVSADADWVPEEPERSLYLRPVLFASETALALRPAEEFTFLLFAFVTERFFADARPVTVWADREYVRASPGGTGAAKCAGNYAASYAAQARAAAQGCDQVVWLDAQQRRWVEELGGMNIFFVQGKGSAAQLVTPPSSGTILPGVTRDTLLTLAATRGWAVEERPVSIDEWCEGCRSGRITEVFACGTAAQVSPVGAVRSADGGWTVGEGKPGPVTLQLADLLDGIHRGRRADPHGWMHYV
ncbi:branched-chain amino acid aminotransferase [Streptomyces caniferus]|uniref:branched-chain amino acid aminotransferase n=1 Tax=Streptomyces caniferus TaxID=285557 RepID=UPI0038274775